MLSSGVKYSEGTLLPCLGSLEGKMSEEREKCTQEIAIWSVKIMKKCSKSENLKMEMKWLGLNVLGTSEVNKKIFGHLFRGR